MNFQASNLLLKNSLDYNHKKIRAFGLNNSECAICSFIFMNAECSQDASAKGLQMDKTTLSKAVNSLEAKGMIVRKQDKIDHRKKLLRLTRKGNQVCVDLMEIHKNWLEEVLSVLTPEEQRIFDDICARLTTKAEEMLNAEK